MNAQEQIQIAKICHEVNRAYCQSIGDTSQLSWDEAPEWQRNSAINGVLYALQSDRTPEEMHESWLKQKLEEGWVYGKEKDPISKTHPCMVRYNELPKYQRTKDYLFRAVVECFK
jgi:hypothetical protein